MIMQFKDVLECIMCGRKVRACQWSSEYYLTFSQGEIWLMPAQQHINLAQLNIWRQLYTSWEIMK